jgi:hypothetical protein
MVSQRAIATYAGGEIGDIDGKVGRQLDRGRFPGCNNRIDLDPGLCTLEKGNGKIQCVSGADTPMAEGPNIALE